MARRFFNCPLPAVLSLHVSLHGPLPGFLRRLFVRPRLARRRTPHRNPRSAWSECEILRCGPHLANSRLGSGSGLWYIERIKGEIGEVVGFGCQGSGFGNACSEGSPAATLTCVRNGRSKKLRGIVRLRQLTDRQPPSKITPSDHSRQPTGIQFLPN